MSTVAQERLKGTVDNLLLASAAAGFEVLVTVDRNLAFQQNVGSLPVTVVVLRARTNRLIELIPLVPELLQVLNHLPPRQLVQVPQSSSP
ncbi:MAG: hypothetical protein ABIP55_01255 [Tepidisphaeraceae bacterium]